MLLETTFVNRPRIARARAFAIWLLSGAVYASMLIAAPMGEARANSVESSSVVPIDWSDFDAPAPSHPDSVRVHQILLNSNRYALTTWWESSGYDSQPGPYLDLGARPGPAYESFALAVSLSTDAYDAEEVGVSRDDALEATLKLVRSLALDHKSNTDGGWGDGWQDAIWSGNAGYAGWLLWDHLSQTDQEYVRRMVEHEADRYIGYDVPYYRDDDGEIIRSGNTAAEENAWGAIILSLATAMMPDHPNWRKWMDKNLELMLSAFSRPEDVKDTGTVVNGKPLAEWLGGSNVESNGLLVNHNRFHPDYMTTVDLNLMAVFAYTLAGQATPKAAFHNADIVYAALDSVEFASPPYEPPGGTIYVDESPDVYYPEGTDWSPTRRMIFATLDVMARAFGLDDQSRRNAAYWERLHADGALAQQERHPDGRMFAPGEHDSEANDGAAVPARAYLTKWLTSQGGIKVTDRAYPLRPWEGEHAGLLFDLPDVVEAGQSHRIEAELENTGDMNLSQVDFSLDLPDGWTFTPSTPVSFDAIRPGEAVTVAWDVDVSTEAEVAPAELTALARYRLAGRSLTAETTAQTWIAPAGRVSPDQIAATATSAQGGYEPGRAFDDDLTTMWHSQWNPYIPMPHTITLDLGAAYDVTELHYQPRLNNTNGIITRYEIHASSDGEDFSEVAMGEWDLNHAAKKADIDAQDVRYVQLEAIEGGGDFASAAELAIVGTPNSD